MVQPLFEKEKPFKIYASNINPRVDVKTGVVKNDIELSFNKLNL